VPPIVTIKALAVRPITKAQNFADLEQTIADLQANSNSAEATIRSIIDFLKSGGASSKPITPLGTSNQTIINVAGTTGSDTSFWRLCSYVIKTATVTTEQDLFDGSEESVGNRARAPSWWVVGRRLVLSCDLPYSLTGANKVTIRTRIGATTLQSMDMTEAQDLGTMIIVATVAAVAGTVVTLNYRVWYTSPLWLAPDPFGIVTFDHGGLTQNIQIGVKFDSIDGSSTITAKGADFDGLNQPAA
jgi:hypothetical protein